MNKLEEGINSYLSGDVNGAIKYLQEYIQLQPSSGQAYYYFGLAYNDIGKYTEAGACFAKALELEPGKGTYHYQLGQIYANMMLFERAIPHLLETVKQNPEHVRAHYILGTIYFQNGDLDAAASQFTTVTKISPSYAAGFYELGNCLYYKGEIEIAKQAFEQAVRLDSTTADAYYKLGKIYSDEKYYDKAVEYLSKAYSLGMDDPAFLSYYVLTLAANGQKEKAQTLVDIIEQSHPDLPEIVKLKETLN